MIPHSTQPRVRGRCMIVAIQIPVTGMMNAEGRVNSQSAWTISR